MIYHLDRDPKFASSLADSFSVGRYSYPHLPQIACPRCRRRHSGPPLPQLRSIAEDERRRLLADDRLEETLTQVATERLLEDPDNLEEGGRVDRLEKWHYDSSGVTPAEFWRIRKRVQGLLGLDEEFPVLPNARVGCSEFDMSGPIECNAIVAADQGGYLLALEDVADAIAARAHPGISLAETNAHYRGSSGDRRGWQEVVVSRVGRVLSGEGDNLRCSECRLVSHRRLPPTVTHRDIEAAADIFRLSDFNGLFVTEDGMRWLTDAGVEGVAFEPLPIPAYQSTGIPGLP
jgi:hypothetical protein